MIPLKIGSTSNPSTLYKFNSPNHNSSSQLIPTLLNPAAMSKTSLSYVFLSSLLLLLFFSPLSSAIRNHVMAKPSKSSPLRSFPKTQAQKLIKSFNLSPKHDINNGDVGHVMDESPMMVEKPLRLPVLGDPAGNNSIQDLGHHAGYYRLPNTVDARYVILGSH